MKKLKESFITNANGTGVQEFRQYKHGTNLEGKDVYIYERFHTTGDLIGKRFGIEVFIAMITKAGTYPLPGGKTITYEEDFHQYPGASAFGRIAWFHHHMKFAEEKFDELMNKGEVEEVIVSDNGTEIIVPLPTDSVENEPKHRGRKKQDRPELLYPVSEFSIGELAEFNKIEYPICFVALKEQETLGVVKFVREERRNARGKATRLFVKV